MPLMMRGCWLRDDALESTFLSALGRSPLILVSLNLEEMEFLGDLVIFRRLMGPRLFSR